MSLPGIERIPLGQSAKRFDPRRILRGRQEWFDLKRKLQYMSAILQPGPNSIERNKEVSF